METKVEMGEKIEVDVLVSAMCGLWIGGTGASRAGRPGAEVRSLIGPCLWPRPATYYLLLTTYTYTYKLMAMKYPVRGFGQLASLLKVSLRAEPNVVGVLWVSKGC